MFTKKVEVKEKEKLIIVEITCRTRTAASEIKIRFIEDPKNSIPEKHRNNLTLISKPDMMVSNINDKQKYINKGIWVFKINENKTNKTRKKSSTTPRTKSR